MSVKEPLCLFADGFHCVIQICVRGDVETNRNPNTSTVEVVYSHVGSVDCVALEDQRLELRGDFIDADLATGRQSDWSAQGRGPRPRDGQAYGACRNEECGCDCLPTGRHLGFEPVRRFTHALQYREWCQPGHDGERDHGGSERQRLSVVVWSGAAHELGGRDRSERAQRSHAFRGIELIALCCT